MDPFNTVGELIRYIRTKYSHPNALNYYKNDAWHSISTESFLNQVKNLTLALVKLGLKRGDRVGILVPPSPQWTIANIAIIMAGGVSIPLFANISEENYIFEVTQTELKFLFVEGEDQWNRYTLHPAFVKTAIAFDRNSSNNGVLGYQEALNLGAELDKVQPELFAQLENEMKPTDLANIIYTSGSTGTPKGVELTQKNITALINQDAFDLNRPGDRFLSILPLAHIYGYTLNFLMLGWGVPIYYFNDLKTLGKICQDLHPTIVVLVPRLLEKIYAKMLSRVQEAGTMKKQLGKWAFDFAAHEHTALVEGLIHPIVDKLVYHTLRESLGGALRIVITGGAALNPTLCRFFIEIGIPLYEGWGMTEATVITVNRPTGRKIGTVGQPLHGMQIKIAEGGEILAKGPVVMRGYYRNPEMTSATLDSEGWLHTGDKGTIDSENFLTIIGRIKELYKTSTGEYIAPIPIEQALCQAPLIDMAMVVADNLKFASALLFPNFEVLETLKKLHHAANMTNEEFLKSPFIQEEMNKLIANINSHLNRWEQIRAYRFILEPPSIEAGELTPSMKLRRDVILKKYQKIIDEMYQEDSV